MLIGKEFTKNGVTYVIHSADYGLGRQTIYTCRLKGQNAYKSFAYSELPEELKRRG